MNVERTLCHDIKLRENLDFEFNIKNKNTLGI